VNVHNRLRVLDFSASVSKSETPRILRGIMAELDALKLLRRIEEGVAGKTGEAFFRQIVCDLSSALGAHGAFTSRLLPDRRARMMAFWVGGAYETCLEYALEGTPCEFVYRGEITAHARNIGEVFPVDRAWFEQLGVKSYLGIPVKDETGSVCGHLAVMDTRERDWAEADVDVLRLFSLRSAAEIERTRYQRELEEANGALRAANERLAAEVAQRQAMEEQLASAKTQAESANHAKSVFISQMSHELRTPLNGILGFAQLLRRDANPTAEKVRDGLSVIERSGDHLLKLVNDLLDLARIEAGKLELMPARIDLGELLEHVASLASVRAANAGLTLNVAVDKSAFRPVMADERVVRQILLNLLGNAVKFTDAGGRISLRAEVERADADRQHVRFVVADSGIGIEKEQLERIFEPFHRVSNPNRTVEGTGLGLAITQRLVAAMNGRLRVTSERGVGSTFEVECELAVAPPAQVALLSAAEVEGYEGPIRSVLVADDDRDNRKLVRELLEALGFRVQDAGHGAEALEKLTASRPDLLLTDLVMPQMDGMALVRAVRAGATTQALPVIAMSASASDYTRDEALRAGCSSFLSKPLQLAAFIAEIGEQLHLQWRYRSAAPPRPPGVNPPSTSARFDLPQDIATELQHLAKQGDVLGLAARIEQSLANDPAAREFCDEMRGLAARYDIRGIRQALATRCGV